MSSLKPCPNRGCTAIEPPEIERQAATFVQCCCGVRGPYSGGDDSASIGWNLLPRSAADLLAIKRGDIELLRENLASDMDPEMKLYVGQRWCAEALAAAGVSRE